MSLWSGRFEKSLDEKIFAFNASIAVDSRMFVEDIEGSIAHATMLGGCGILTPEEAGTLCAGLRQLLTDIGSGALPIDPAAEDIHMFVEEQLTLRLGEVGKKLHTARSRNDQVATDLRLYLLRAIDKLAGSTTALAQALCTVAEQHTGSIMPGYTHLQVAQPVTFAHHLLAYVQMLLRDLDRLRDCKKRTDALPLGSCALAGTGWAIDRHKTAELLGFSAVCGNSMDGVSDRDFCIELAAVLSLLMTHLSRLCEEVILWCSAEFGFVTLDDAFSTGSSIMPQKKNPDIAELVRGKTGRVHGNLVALLTLLKGLPLAYNKDMQEDKEALFDSIDTATDCLEALAPMLLTMQVNTARMREAAAKGFINATDCADYLAAKGVPFREAYTIVGKLVRQCLSQNTTLEQLPLAAYQALSPAFGDDVFAAIALEQCLAVRTSYGGPSPAAVQQQLKEVKLCLAM